MSGSDIGLNEQEFELFKVNVTLLVLGLSVFIALFFALRFQKLSVLLECMLIAFSLALFLL